MKAIKLYKHDPDWRVPPGTILKEHLEDCNISKETFAKIINTNLDTLENIFSGNVTLTEDIASILEIHTKIPKSFWLRAEENYRKPITKRK